MNKKIIKQSSVIIGLLGLLAIPFMSSGDVIIACKTEVSKSFSNTCLPDPTGGVTPGSISLGGGLSLSMSSEARSTLIFGAGIDFGAAWRDAEQVCEKMLATVNQKGNGQIYSVDFLCPMASCEVVESPKEGPATPFTGTCVCVRSFASKKHTGNQCVELGRSNHSEAYAFTYLYTQGLRTCAQTAQKTKDVGQVYCFNK